VQRYLNLYRTQISVLRHWRGGPFALAKRLAIILVLSAIAFAITDWLDPGISILRPIGAVEMVVIMALLNAVVRPLVLALVAPHSLLLTGITVLVAQVLVFFAAAQLAPDVTVDGAVSAIIGSFLYAILNSVLTAFVGVDSSDSFYSLLIQQMLMQETASPTDRPGLVIVQIDGLAYPILAGRIRAGSVNTMAPWLNDGTHVLSRWEVLLPSMTSASQAGILHGNNDGIPAFRWYERDRHHLMVSSNPADAAEIVRRVSNGQGLLSNNGASIGNLVTGDATRSYLTTAALREPGQGLGESRAFLGFFFSPTGYVRAITMFIGELLKEQVQARRTRRSGMQPQLRRGLKYAGMRAASNVIVRQLNTSLVIEEMYRGTNVIYADFTGYDELAHHCGPERVESFDALDGVDRVLGTLERAASHAPRPYRFVVLSDHGQSLGATFKQRYGKTLGEVVRDLMGGRATLFQPAGRGEGGASVNTFLSEVTRSQGVGPAVARAAFAGRTAAGHVNLEHHDVPPPAAQSTIVVVGSGNLGLVWFTGHDHRLISSRSGAWVIASSRRRLATVCGPNGTVGSSPSSQYDHALGHVAAFEELIGSHGGLGGPQTEGFILHPADWALDEDVPVGAPAIYRNLRAWLASIDIRLGRSVPAAGSDDPSPPTQSGEPIRAA
jgi:uncharacterized membrane protein YvlD (DUF360 family)